MPAGRSKVQSGGQKRPPSDQGTKAVSRPKIEKDTVIPPVKTQIKG